MGRKSVEHVFISGVEHKPCSKCRDWLPVGCFVKQVGAADGLAYHCDYCRKEYRDKKAAEKKSKRPKFSLSPSGKKSWAKGENMGGVFRNAKQETF